MTSKHTETVATMAVTHAEIHVHAQTIIVVAAMTFLTVAQMFSIIGSGLLAQSITRFVGYPSSAVWLSTTINICGSALNPTISQVADYWGRKWVLVVTTGAAVVGSIIVSRAQNLVAVIIGFCCMGIMFGGQAASFAVAGEVLPRKYRALGQASINIASGVAATCSALFCGALVRDDHPENFRTYFYVLTALFAISTASIVLYYNPPPRELQKNLTQTEKLRRLDWVGIFTFTVGTVLFCIALAWSDNPYQWNDAHILAIFVIGMLLLITFCIYEWRFKKNGIAEHGLFKDKNYAIALACGFLEGLSVFAMNSYYVFEAVAMFNLDFFEACCRYAMGFAVGFPFGFISAWYITRFKAVREVMIFGLLMILVFFILMATVKLSTPLGFLWGYPVINAAGVGCLLTTIFVTGQLSISGDLIAVGTGLLAAARGLGGLVGLVVNNAIFNGATRKHIPTKIAAAVLPFGLDPSTLAPFISALTSGNPQAVASVPGVTPEMIAAGATALRQAYSIAFRNVWIAAACFTIPALVASCFLRNPTEAFNAHIDAPVEEKLVELQAEIEAMEKAEGGAHDADLKEKE